MMEEKEYVVYAHINKINKKVYVGQTCQMLQRRWRDGKGYIAQNTYFANAITKYGWDNFTHIVLEEGLTKDEADYYEKFYIKEFHSNENQYGYNLTLGGGGVLPSEETREKMKKNHTNYKGEKNPMYGKNIKDFMSPEKYKQWIISKQAYGAAHRGGNSIFAKKVYCYEKDKTYDSLVEAADDCNISVGGISSCLNGYGISAGCDEKTGLRLHWCYAEDKDIFQPPSQDKSLSRGEYHFRVQKIYCFELDEIFYGVGEVQRKYNITTSHLYDCLHGKRKSCGKHPVTGELLHWCYFEDKDSYIIPDSKESKRLGEYHHGAKAIYCIELNELFDTAVEASKKYGFPNSHIGAVCKGKRKSCGTHPVTNQKLHWLFLDDAIEQGYVTNEL